MRIVARPGPGARAGALAQDRGHGVRRLRSLAHPRTMADARARRSGSALQPDQRRLAALQPVRRRPPAPAPAAASRGTARSARRGSSTARAASAASGLQHARRAVRADPPERGPVGVVVVVGQQRHARVGRRVGEAAQPRGALRLRVDRVVDGVPGQREDDGDEVRAGPPRRRWRAGRRGRRRSAPGPPRASFAVQLGDRGLEALQRALHHAPRRGRDPERPRACTPSRS